MRVVPLLILGLAIVIAYLTDAEAGWFSISPQPEPEPEPVEIQEPTSTDWLVLAIHPDDICAARYMGGHYVCVCATRREVYAFHWNNLGPLSPEEFFVRHMPDVNRNLNPIEQQACAELREYFL